MNKWTVDYYKAKNGDCPIEEFVNSSTESNQTKILGWFGKLEEEGPNLPRPYSDLLRDGIHELRIRLSGNQTRVLYFFCYQKHIILTHDFNKNTQKVPEAEIEKALSIRKEFLGRIKKEDLEV
jgi:hypothetical protein